ncbi:MAG: winged helix-turn-helix domain-containing protein [Verrucomicrobiota bacterium]
MYRFLARQGWRKVAPDTRHPKSDPQVQEDWKKTSGSAGDPVESRGGPGPLAPGGLPRRGAFWPDGPRWVTERIASRVGGMHPSQRPKRQERIALARRPHRPKTKTTFKKKAT